MLGAAMAALMQRNPRLVVLSYAIKLLAATGFAPQLTHCVHCGEAVTAQDDAWFSPLQGGLICSSCKSSYNGDGLEPCSAETRELWQITSSRRPLGCEAARSWSWKKFSSSLSSFRQISR